MRRPPAKPRHKVPAPQANGVAARLRPPAEAGGGREVFGRGWGLIFQNVKSDISGIFRGLVGKRWKMGALGITPPSSLVLLPIEGRRSPWRRLRNADMVSGVRGCFMVRKVILRGFLMFFWVRALAVVARVARGGQACASPGRCHATKCLLRRQTESQRDFVHQRKLASGDAASWIDGAGSGGNRL